MEVSSVLLWTLREEVRRTSVGCTGVAGSAVGQSDITVRYRYQDHPLTVRTEVSRARRAERDGARGGPIVAGCDGQLSADLLRRGEFIRRIGALLPTVQAAPGGGRRRCSSYGVRCSIAESRNSELHCEAAIAVNVRATPHKVRILSEHSDSHEACEGNHGIGENTYSFHLVTPIFGCLMLIPLIRTMGNS